MIRVATGLDVLREEYWKILKGRRLGYLCNQASLDARLKHGKQIIAERLPGHLKALFGPQHGHGGEDQDNMVETEHARDSTLGIPVFSLYSAVREPSRNMLDLVDTLIIDLQDVGTRVYTFASTMLNCLKSAAKSGKQVIILDRPNPLGGDRVEGNLLRPQLYSFVGPSDIPMRHGLTMGEMGKFLNGIFDIGCDLEVIALKGWRRGMLWEETGLKWIMPSPNMPHADTALVYPGQVVWEGTNVSEGRGTCRPFEIFGAPYLDTRSILEKLSPDCLQGCHLQEITFRPTFHKWEGDLCNGFMMHILDVKTFQPYFTTLAVLGTVIALHGERFHWKEPPYEYEFERMPIDLILGDTNLRRELETGEDLFHIREKWQAELNEYIERREPHLLYH